MKTRYKRCVTTESENAGFYSTLNGINGMFPMTRGTQHMAINKKLRDRQKEQREVGARLREFREAMNYAPVEMAQRLKISPQRWYNYETGKRPLDLAVAKELRRLETLSLDYIFCGDRQGLPVALLRFLDAKAALLKEK